MEVKSFGLIPVFPIGFKDTHVHARNALSRRDCSDRHLLA